MPWKWINTQRFMQGNAREIKFCLTLFCSFLFTPAGWTQESEATSAAPATSYVPRTTAAPSGSAAVATSGMGTSQLRSFIPFDSGDPLAPSSLLRWGPIALSPSVTYRITYGDGLQAQPGDETKTVIQEVIPVFSFQLGNHWALTYTPTFRFYSDSAFEDSIDQSFSLSGGTTYENWSLGASHGYSFSSTPLVETGAQTDQESHSTSLSAGYQINSKASLELGLNQSLRFTGDPQQSSLEGQDLGDTREWTTIDWFNYQFWPKFTVGIGAGLGYVDAESDMTYEQIHGRIIWLPSGKLTLSISCGYEARQFLGSDQSDLFNPLYSVSFRYQLFEATSISLSASHTVNTSYFENQVTEDTTFDLGLSQRLLGRLTLTLGAGMGMSKYKGATTEVNPNREDDRIYYSAALSMPVTARGSVSVFYSASENSSDESDFDYSSTQVGAQFTYQF